MKKFYSLLSVMLLTVLISACGTTTNESENTNDLPTTEATENGQSQNNSTSSNEPQQVLEGTTTESESQNYSITVVEGFELTGEEPNKDLLFNKENDLQSMRIETFNKEEVNLEETTNNLMETLKASNEEGTLEEITDENQLPASDTIQQAKGFQIDTPDGKVTGYTFETDGLIVKLTIFDTADTPALETFIQMAGTIKSK
ncbi:hypothetical protein [Psychrobacillus sp. FJAT-21963]|uniref:hypothetical protein n=1 Tax=Psychrobacillus sp. FJAT-21963 TaxID=1712028 RepID=UPI0006F5B430|nr:hypothetical protein [Psychrobacillus sp. FJAT-21963]KQL36643.1 hypothetical protein AN959_00790 [Psychrobacillus sp. FJAT-21963]